MGSRHEHRKELRKLLNNRSDGSIERKHQNISAILITLGCPYIAGYKPLGNFQALLYEVVGTTLLDDPIFDRAALAAATQPEIGRAHV